MAGVEEWDGPSVLRSCPHSSLTLRPVVPGFTRDTWLRKHQTTAAPRVADLPTWSVPAGVGSERAGVVWGGAW